MLPFLGKRHKKWGFYLCDRCPQYFSIIFLRNRKAYHRVNVKKVSLHSFISQMTRNASELLMCARAAAEAAAPRPFSMAARRQLM